MIRTITNLLLLCFSANLMAQQADLDIQVPEGPKPWTSLELNNDDDRFQFAIVTDRTGGHRPGVFMDGVNKLNLLQPEFVMSVGDLIEGYTEDLDELDRQWDEFENFVAKLQMPFFYVPGNHDITNKVMEDVYKERFGQTNYYFIYKDVLFMCLNSEDQYRGASRGSISTPQYEWIKKTLSENSDVKWTLLFMHQPLWLQDVDPVRWPDVEELLSDREHTVFVGHRHHYVKYERNNGKYFMLATTGGGSSLRGPEMGEFDHVVWVTMTEQGPILANLQLEGIWSEDVNTEDKQAFIDRVMASNPIRIEPLYTDGDMESGELRIRMTNDADVPMLVKIDAGFSWNYTAALMAPSYEVAPNSVAFATVQLSPRRTSDSKAEQKDAQELHFNISYLDDSKAKLSIPFSYNVAPEKRYEIAAIDTEIDIDGQINEFATLPYTITAEDKAAEDLSASFNLAYTDEDIYFAARVQDSDLQVDTADAGYRQDYLSLIIDAAPMNISAMRTGRSWFSESLVYLLSPATETMPSSDFYAERLPEGTEWICKATDNGYIFEGRIALENIRKQQGENWETLRVQVGIQDRDSGDSEFPRYYWMPNWRGDNNRVGSGMFFRKDMGN